jgi:hypothetical protein
MKAYRLNDTYFAPGSQPKGAEKVDVPTDTQGLVTFLNDLTVTWGDGEDHELHEGEPVDTRPQGFPQYAIDHAKAPQEALSSPRIDEEAFEALPLPFQLHLAALALENARGRLKP